MTRMYPLALIASAFLAAMASASAASEGGDYGLPLRGIAAETFLRQAKLVARKPIGVGITRPEKLTLSDGEQTLHAVWKTVDNFKHGLVKGRRGGYQLGLRDSYRYEIAAYELDKLLGLGIVPPTVEREFGGRRGSLQLWVEGGFTELDRREKELEAPDLMLWSNRLGNLRVFQGLVYDSDYLNIRNILYDPNFQVYSIDHSRAFRTYPELVQEELLRRFSRSLLARLETLDRLALQAALGDWLNDSEIEGLLRRRDKIIERASVLADELGADSVYYR